MIGKQLFINKKTVEKNITKRKLAKLLDSLSALEIKRFQRFVQSPYHNTNPEVKTLLDWLRKHNLDFEAAKLTNALIYRRLFGKQPFDADRLQEVFSKLSRLAEDFLIQEHLRTHRRQQKDLLVEVLRERDYSLFKRETLKLAKEIEEQNAYKTGEDYLLLHQLQHHLWYHDETDKFTREQFLLDQSQVHLDNFYQLQKLQYIASLAARANFLNTEKESLLTQLTTQFLEQPIANLYGYEMLYGLVSKLLLSGTAADYFTLKAKVVADFSFLSLNHQKNLLVHLVNFAIQYQQSDPDFSEKEIFSLYKLGVKQQIFIHNGYIRDVEFTNICIIGFQQKAFEWTNGFIQNHQTYLTDKQQEYIIPFVKAYGAFFAEDFEVAIINLRAVQPTHPLKHLCRIKTLLVRAYFECVRRQIGNYIRILPYELESFRKLMERNQKNSTVRTEAYLNFAFLTKKMIPLLNQPTFPLLTTLEKLIAETKPLVLKKWLLENLSALKKAAPRAQ